jgi:hypothetical protein
LEAHHRGNMAEWLSAPPAAEGPELCRCPRRPTGQHGHAQLEQPGACDTDIRPPIARRGGALTYFALRFRDRRGALSFGSFTRELPLMWIKAAVCPLMMQLPNERFLGGRQVMLRSACQAWRSMLVMLVVGACTITDPVRHEAHQQPIPPGARVLLMKPDIECSAVLASGLVEPNAAWTAEAEGHVEAALKQLIEEQQAQVVTYDAARLAPDRVARHRELSRLYEAVAVSMVTRGAIPTASRPCLSGRTRGKRLG